MEMRIQTAEYGMRDALIALWLEAFGGSEEEAIAFFRCGWQPQTTLVAEEKGRILSALHMLPCQMLAASGERVPAHYIYAAATGKAYRSKGYMGALLEEAARLGEARGEYASVLLPGEASLYRYYHRFGYRTVFGVRECSLDRQALLENAGPLPREKVVLTGKECAAVRERCLEHTLGSVMWGPRAVQKALEMQRYNGEGVTFSRQGYCIFAPDGTVRELMAPPGGEEALLVQAASQCRGELLRVRLPVTSPLLPGLGEVQPRGMMRPLRPSILAGFPADGTPYLGLTLE